MPFIKTITDEQRLLAKRRIDDKGCWLWTGYFKKPTSKKNYLPYGYVHVGSRTDGTIAVRQVHRVAASIWLGLDLSRADIHVLHKCDNPRCFNPDHLFFGDNDLNVADRQAKGRHRGGNGLTNPNAKLDPEKVRVIRLLSLYTSQRALGRKFGVDKSVIRAVLKGETWVHVV